MTRGREKKKKTEQEQEQEEEEEEEEEECISDHLTPPSLHKQTQHTPAICSAVAVVWNNVCAEFGKDMQCDAAVCRCHGCVALTQELLVGIKVQMRGEHLMHGAGDSQRQLQLLLMGGTRQRMRVCVQRNTASQCLLSLSVTLCAIANACTRFVSSLLLCALQITTSTYNDVGEVCTLEASNGNIHGFFHLGVDAL